MEIFFAMNIQTASLEKNRKKPSVTETKPENAAWNRLAQTNRKLFNICLHTAKACGEAGKNEEAVQWCSVAAWANFGKSWFGELSSNELELELLRAARQLPTPSATPPWSAGSRPRPRWLHVLSEAYETFGHTNFCRRWIQRETGIVHDVMLVNQHNEIPDNLVSTVKQAQGKLIVLDPLAPLLQRANELRTYAWENVDQVVLHTHPDEILGTIAFGVEGGPPVFVVNHSDHVFWVGASIADLIVEIRESGLVWTRDLRGVTDRSLILPIPLLEEDSNNSETARLQNRQLVRKKIGIPENALMLLTVGAPAKYQPMLELDFMAVAQRIVNACDNNTYLVAVGPFENAAWKNARRATGGRILAIGRELDARPFCRAADVYLEGFPIGSLTALLEAGQAGLPCVRAPAESVPPFSSDSGSLDGIPQPKNIDDYVNAVLSLAGDARRRAEMGTMLQQAIVAQHCGENWLERLGAIKRKITGPHRVYPQFTPASVGAELCDWWLRLKHPGGSAPSVRTVTQRLFIEAWKRTDSKFIFDQKLWRQLNTFDENHERGRSFLDECRERLVLWQLNNAIRSQGGYDKFATAANVAVRTGRYSLARKLVYRCIRSRPACLFETDWLKLFVKSYASQKLVSRLQRFRSERTRHLNYFNQMVVLGYCLLDKRLQPTELNE